MKGGTLSADEKREVVAMPMNWNRNDVGSIHAMPGPIAANSAIDEVLLVPITDVSIKLRTGCSSQVAELRNDRIKC